MKRIRRARPGSRGTVLQLVALVVVAILTGVLTAVALTQDPRPPGTTAEPSVTIPPEPKTARVTVLGDSTVAGSGADSGADARWPALLEIPFDAWRTVIGASDSGYIAASPSRGAYRDLVSQVPPNSDFVIITGSRVDSDRIEVDPELAAAEDADLDALRAEAIRARADEIETAATELYAAIREQAPASTIIAVSLTWTGEEVPAEAIANRDAVKRASSAAGVAFVDALDWLEDARDGIAANGIHLNDLGHRILAEKMTAALAPILREAWTPDQT